LLSYNGEPTIREEAVIPSPSERDALFRTFGRAWFKQDLDLMFQVVTPDFLWTASPAAGDTAPSRVEGRAEVAAEFARRNTLSEGVRFSDVVYHHAPDASFMTSA
jgi:ketosteroid isomerase-like protein